MVVKRLLNGRFQFIRVVSTKHYSKTYLMADHDDPAHPKCIAKHLQMPSRNPITLRFLSELLHKRVSMLKRLGEHDSIAEVLLTIQDGQDFYCLRPFIPGQSLQAELVGQPSCSEEFIHGLLEELLTTLDVVQEQGVVHQNLQPSNIIRRSDNRLVLVDFSLVHESEQLHPPGATNGSTPSPPEASVYLPDVRGRRFSRFNADHFAVGMIALQFATGLSTEALPHMGQNDFLEQVQLQLDECSTLSAGLKRILLGMVTPQPDKQFHRAKDILGQLATINQPQPVPLEEALPPALAATAAPEGRVRSHLSAGPPSQTHRWGLLLAGVALVAGGLLWLNLPQRLRALWLNRQAQTAVTTGQSDQALTHLNQIIELQPRNGSALAQRADISMGAGQLRSRAAGFNRCHSGGTHHGHLAL